MNTIISETPSAELVLDAMGEFLLSAWGEQATLPDPAFILIAQAKMMSDMDREIRTLKAQIAEGSFW